MGKINITPEDFQVAAIKYRKELLMLPLIALQTSTKYMTVMSGIAGKEIIGEANFDSQFAPYKADRQGTANLDLKLRALETYFGNVVETFEPNQVVKTVFAGASTLGDSQKNVPVTKLALASLAKNLGANLNRVLWKAKYKATGDTSADLFDGFDTITEAELTATNLSADKKNYLKLTEEITDENAVDVAKSIIQAMTPELREQDTFMFCDYAFYDHYCEAYKATGAGFVYNKQYEQVTVEGSNHRCTLIPLANKEGSNFIHVTTKSNMLVGCDQMSDAENIQVDRFSPFILTFSATMFFGTQFNTIDGRRMLVVDKRTGA